MQKGVEARKEINRLGSHFTSEPSGFEHGFVRDGGLQQRPASGHGITATNHSTILAAFVEGAKDLHGYIATSG
jgi:hypothetical protein